MKPSSRGSARERAGPGGAAPNRPPWHGRRTFRARGPLSLPRKDWSCRRQAAAPVVRAPAGPRHAIWEHLGPEVSQGAFRARIHGLAEFPEGSVRTGGELVAFLVDEEPLHSHVDGGKMLGLQGRGGFETGNNSLHGARISGRLAPGPLAIPCSQNPGRRQRRRRPGDVLREGLDVCVRPEIRPVTPGSPHTIQADCFFSFLGVERRDVTARRNGFREPERPHHGPADPGRRLFVEKKRKDASAGAK